MVERKYSVPHARIRSASLVLFASAFMIGFGAVANHHLNLATTISVYLFVTLAIAHNTGFAEASIVSVVATLCLEFYFAPPLLSFRVDLGGGCIVKNKIICVLLNV